MLLKQLGKAIDAGQKRSIEVDVSNTDRAFGTILGSEITRKLGDDVEEDTYHVLCKGAGGQSFGAFIPKGLTWSWWVTVMTTSARAYPAVSWWYIPLRQQVQGGGKHHHR